MPADTEFHEVADGVLLAARAEAGQFCVVDDVARLNGIDVGQRDGG